MNAFPNRILWATDGSEDATLAARATADLSRRLGSELHVVHAWRAELPRAYFVAVSSPQASWYKQQAEKLLAEQVERIEGFGGKVDGAHLREGRPAEKICMLAEELVADLVVVGSRGLGTVKRLMVGSVSEEVVSFAPCPVLVMRGGEGVWPPSRVVIGDDSSEEAKKAGELAIRIAKLLGAEVLLVQAHPLTIAMARRASHVRRFKELLKRGEEFLEKRAVELENILGTRPETRVVVGDAAATIRDVAEEGGEPTLVAVGRRGLGAVKRLVLGSVSTNTLRAVSGPVLITPSLCEVFDNPSRVVSGRRRTEFPV